MKNRKTKKENLPTFQRRVLTILSAIRFQQKLENCIGQIKDISCDWSMLLTNGEINDDTSDKETGTILSDREIFPFCLKVFCNVIRVLFYVLETLKLHSRIFNGHLVLKKWPMGLASLSWGTVLINRFNDRMELIDWIVWHRLFVWISIGEINRLWK